ncbi:putative reverse transcriptase domain-containing protein [Tanacetum coccineum]
MAMVMEMVEETMVAPTKDLWRVDLETLTEMVVRGRDAANAMAWNDFKALLTTEFNPSNEIEKLETAILTAGILTDEEVRSGTLAKAMKSWKAPTSPSEVRSFLGLAGYYRRFIKNFSKIAKPLTSLTQKNQKYEWGEKQEEAFRTLKDNLCNAPILSLPDGVEDFVVYCDASNQGLGCVLMQRDKVWILQESQENGQNRKNTDTGTDRVYKSRENAFKVNQTQPFVNIG